MSQILKLKALKIADLRKMLKCFDWWVIEKWDSNCEMGFCDVPNFEAESLENSGFEKNVKMF